MMKKIASILSAAFGVALGACLLTFITAPIQSDAQTGQLRSGEIWGNPTTGANLARPTTLSSMADLMFGATPGTVLIRGTTQWSFWLGNSGAIPYFNTDRTLTSSALLPQNSVMVGGGVAGSPTTVITNGNIGLLLHGNALGAPGWGPLNFTNDTLTGLLTPGNIDIATTSQWFNNTANKVLATNQIWSAGTLTTLTHGTNVAVDMSLGVNFVWTLTSTPTTLLSPSNIKVGQTGIIWLVNSVTGGTITLGSTWKTQSGAGITPSLTNGYVDILSYACRTVTFCAIAKSADFR